MFTYSPFTGNLSTGWRTYCNAPPAVNCDGYTAHATSAQSSLSISFNGTGIALYGNMTESIALAATLEDGTTPNHGVDSASQVLTGFSGLQQADHTVTLNVNPSSAAAVLYFTEAVISVDTGVPNVDVVLSYIDSADSRITYDSGWYNYSTYASDTPPSVSNDTFYGSMVAGAAASIRFNGNAVFLYGPCYAIPPTGPYNVQLSPAGIDLDLNTTTPVVNVITDIMETCLRFFATGLDPTVEMEISTQSLVDGQWNTLHYVQVVGFQPSTGQSSVLFSLTGGSGSSALSSPTQTPTTASKEALSSSSVLGSLLPTGKPYTSSIKASSWPANSPYSPSSNRWPIIGGVAGGILVFVAILVGIVIVLRRGSKVGQTLVDPFRPRPSLTDGSRPSSPPSPSRMTKFDRIRASLSFGGRRNADRPPRPPDTSERTELPVDDLHDMRSASRAAVPRSTPSILSAPFPSAQQKSTALHAPLGLSVTYKPFLTSAGGPSVGTVNHSAVSAAAAGSPSLAEITSDVNRIMGELARMGRRPVPGGTGEEEVEEALHDEALPSYAE